MWNKSSHCGPKFAIRSPSPPEGRDKSVWVRGATDLGGKGGRKQQLLRVNHQLFLGIIALYKVSPFIKGPIFVDYIFGKSSVAVGTTNLEK